MNIRHLIGCTEMKERSTEILVGSSCFNAWGKINARDSQINLASGAWRTTSMLRKINQMEEIYLALKAMMLVTHHSLPWNFDCAKLWGNYV